MTAEPASTREHIDLVDRTSAHNYHPLPVVISSAEGVWVTDVEGNRYLDMLAAYSALNFGHQHPDIVKAARDQLERLTLTSRAFHNDQMGPFLRDLAEMAGKDRALPMNTGAEAVETAIKSARKWGYRVKGVPDGRAKILVASGNFHGRTTTIISFSDDHGSREDFGPFTPGFVTVPYGDARALEAAFDDEVVAFLVEPIQGEAGVIVPPEGYLRRARELCTQHGALLIADEIQSGLGRTGMTFACEHEAVVPDVYVLGKALGGGILPLSAVVANDEILGLFRPGEHGSTFGGNPLACAIGRRVIEILNTGEYQRNSAELGAWLMDDLRSREIASVELVRGKGLWVGIVLRPEAGTARAAC
ncbi:MAG TPA: ornithine--oxo-acid transaminase, partial [Actinomycetota bacterium]|nr:ornithine--oxo-acid transaminase [Actinomycetota bacterium]